ncbi:aminopeptidase [Halodesulfurarchaeum sp. HSR-GB]|uniref:aminopeptidase n=1 Tax=Halodesulfurarchaeum sp. HSR-GB TaxID=3074077 RepID=UPI0028577E78|nr:aminopeptidase [Halodesulfurarchaeum sp. HSR-GB]MDR5656714.1 aminopeptidase [Halodesulfurarchaeum sp. HSR-GB]
MDPRIREHARIIVDHSTEIEPGDNVLVTAPPVAEDLAVAVYEELGKRGAHPMRTGGGSRASRAYLRAADPEDFELPEHLLAAVEEADAAIRVRADRNTNEQGDVAPETNTAYQKVRQPISDALMDTRWVLTQHPAPGNAQDAEMSTEAYADFVYEAVNKDWEAQREHQAQMVEILEAGTEVHLKSGTETDLTMRIDGMLTRNDDAEHNLPGGEVFTAPVPDSVEGTVLFDMPLMAQGREITDVYLEFEGGRVVEHSAAKNEDVLSAVLETDDGARRIGELGIGMNRSIDQFTYNMLFDEKMGDTVHLALGRAYEDTVGEDRERNDSAIHMDMIVDMSEDSLIEVDGELVQRNGTFVFEDGFEAN